MNNANILKGLSEDIRNALNSVGSETVTKKTSRDTDNTEPNHLDDESNKVNYNDIDDIMMEVEDMPNPYLALDEVFVFDSEKFRDAVVMPWYRNQDQPQVYHLFL